MQKFLFKLAALVAASMCFKPAEAKLFNASEFVLDNGMQVVVVPNHKAPIVKHMVWYKVGSVDEKIGQGGTAHLLEHLMFRGTKKVKGTELNRVMENNGMEVNAFTGQDFTAYHETMDISKLELAMFLEADRMKNLKITDKDFVLERDIVYQERKQVVENNPIANFAEMSRKVMWQDHPYARPITGMADEILGLKLEDVRAFYNQYYAPNNALLVLSGDIDVAMAKKLAEKYYGEIKKSELAPKTTFPNLEDGIAAKLEVEMPKIGSVRMSKTWLAPSFNTDKSEIYNLIVLSKYLGEGKTSKLYKKLVREKKTALAVSTSYDPLARSYGTFVISAIPADGVSAEDLSEDINQAVAEALMEMTTEDVAGTKQKLLAGMVYLKDNPKDAAEIVGTMLSSGMTLAEIEEYGDQTEAVKFEEVLASGKKLFSKPQRVKGILKPVKEAAND